VLAEADAWLGMSGAKSYEPFLHVERAEFARLRGDDTRPPGVVSHTCAGASHVHPEDVTLTSAASRLYPCPKSLQRGK
jgi:hypothetical protein